LNLPKSLYGRRSLLRTESVLREGKSVLRNTYFTAPLKLLPPRRPPAGERETFGAAGSDRIIATMLSVSAGLMANDRYMIELQVGTGTELVWTSQAYEKLHKMEENTWAERDTLIEVAPNALLIYRPLPTIAFAGSDFRGYTRFNLADESSRLIYSDIFCAGRVAHGEIFQFRRFHQLVEISVGERLLYRDNTDYIPADTSLSGLGIFEGYSHSATIVLCHTGATLTQIRERLEALTGRGVAFTAAATALYGNALLIKAMSHSAQELETLTSAFMS
jgi:urease accessory protein